MPFADDMVDYGESQSRKGADVLPSLVTEDSHSGGGGMRTVGVRDLVNRASALLDELEQGGQPIIVTRRGQPIAVLSAIDAEGFSDYVLAHAPEFVRGRRGGR